MICWISTLAEDRDGRKDVRMDLEDVEEEEGNRIGRGMPYLRLLAAYRALGGSFDCGCCWAMVYKETR